MQIGVIADTHGQLAAGALDALSGVELILHAGDIGRAEVISRLEQVAPVLAVHGNSDAGTPLVRQHPASRWLEREGVRILGTGNIWTSCNQGCILFLFVGLHRGG